MKYIRLVLLALLVVGSASYLTLHKAANLNTNSKSKSQTVNSPALAAEPSPDQAASLWVVVDKGRRLPSSYVPDPLVQPKVPVRGGLQDERLLRSDAAAAMEIMFKNAGNDGLSLMLASGYRSYTTQQQLYGSYAKASGAVAADTFSAHAGYSEHQTGLAADIEPASRNCEVAACFGQTAEGKWLKANCYKFGFIIRYTSENQNTTGYIPEPWHIRYVGIALASKLQNSGQTLEQYFKLPAYLTYSASPFLLQ